jgi:Uma2 family endonuclease
MSTVSPPVAAEQHFLLYGVSWHTYTRLLRIFTDRPGVRLTYDRESLEIMTLTHEHESYSEILTRLVYALTEELNVPVKGGGSTTFRRRRRKRGLEPDSCWWIANEPKVRGKTAINLAKDPPPDLALEIDITHSSIDRLSIYAALGIPEVWQLEKKTLVCHLLSSDGRYTRSVTSRAFPNLVVADVSGFLALLGQVDENGIVRQFREWVRQQAWSKPGPPP